MKKITVNTLSCTGITLIVLAFIGTCFGAQFIFIRGVFESLFANIIIQIGLLVIHRFESKYVLLEYTAAICYTIAVVLTLGALFHWYSSTPVWVLVVMAIGIYLIGLVLGSVQTRREIKEINDLLKQRNHKRTVKQTK